MRRGVLDQNSVVFFIAFLKITGTKPICVFRIFVTFDNSKPQKTVPKHYASNGFCVHRSLKLQTSMCTYEIAVFIVFVDNFLLCFWPTSRRLVTFSFGLSKIITEFCVLLTYIANTVRVLSEIQCFVVFPNVTIHNKSVH